MNLKLSLMQPVQFQLVFFEKTVDYPNENTIWVADMDYAPFLCEKMNQKSSPLFAKLISFW